MINLYINQTFIKIMNILLSDNASTMKLLKQFSHKNFHLCFGIIGISFTIDEQGLFCMTTGEADMKIFTPYDSLSYFVDADRIKFLQKIRIVGSIDLAIKFLEVMSNINISHKFNLDRIYLLPWKMIKILITLHYNFYKNTFAYLQYEKEYIVSASEVKGFCEEVDEIKSKCDFLEYSIKKYKL